MRENCRDGYIFVEMDIYSYIMLRQNTDCHPKYVADLLSARPSCISTYPVVLLSLIQSFR